MKDSSGPVPTKPQVAIGAAVNNLDVLRTCLQRSPDIVAGRAPLRTYQGFTSAALALNKALDEAEADVVVLVHQDVYLPVGFLDGLQAQLARLTAFDPDWAVAGVIGLDAERVVYGQTWSSGLQRMVGRESLEPAAVVTLDEVLLVVRRASGVRFDPAMPGFHLYAADIVQTALAIGKKSYVIPLPIVHHSRPVVRLDEGYHRAYHHMQRKWRAVLPIPNLVCNIYRSSLPLLVRDMRLRWRNYGKTERAEPKDDPVAIARRLGMESEA